MGLRSGLSGTRVGKKPHNNLLLFSWYTLALRFGPSFDIWLIRVIGGGLLAGAILLIFIVLLS
jgi:hypothetical protein